MYYMACGTSSICRAMTTASLLLPDITCGDVSDSNTSHAHFHTHTWYVHRRKLISRISYTDMCTFRLRQHLDVITSIRTCGNAPQATFRRIIYYAYYAGCVPTPRWLRRLPIGGATSHASIRIITRVRLSGANI
jgi:hypothetical protein